MMKRKLLILICIMVFGCKKKPKKIIIEKPKVSNELPVIENIEPYKESENLLTISFGKYQIEFITKNPSVKLLEDPEIKNDTLFIFGPDISELESIEIKGLELIEFKVSQKYESSLILEFDS